MTAEERSAFETEMNTYLTGLAENVFVNVSYSQDISESSYIDRKASGKPKGLPPGYKYINIDYVNIPGSVKFQEFLIADADDEVTNEVISQLNGESSEDEAAAFEAFYTLFETELTNKGSDLRQTLEKLRAIEDFIDFYSQCSESKWISYENKGVVPYCLWVDSDSPSIPFLSGLVDGAYQEVEAVQQMDDLARSLVAGTWQLIDAYTIGYWDCSP